MNLRKGLLQAHLSVLLFGLSGIIAKVVSQNAVVLTGSRAFLAALFLALFLVMRGGFQWPQGRRMNILILSGVLLAAHWVAFYQSIKVSTVAIGVVSVTTFPVMTAILEPIFTDEKWKWQLLLEPILVIIGTLILLGLSPSPSDVQGMLLGFLAAFIYAIIHIINKVHVEYSGEEMLSFVQLLVAGIVLLPWVIMDYDPSLDASGRDPWLIIFLALFCTAIAYTLFIASMRSLTARTTAVLSGLEPVYAIFIAVMFLGERFTCNMFFGALIILTAVVWSSWLSLSAQRRSLKDVKR